MRSRGVDLPLEGPTSLRVIGTAWPGRPFVGSVNPGERVRIMTGALIPEGADTVIMQEYFQQPSMNLPVYVPEPIPPSERSM